MSEAVASAGSSEGCYADEVLTYDFSGCAARLLSLTVGWPPYCRRVSSRAPALMRHKEKRRCSPTSTRRERGADVPGPKSGVHGLSCLVREGSCGPECFGSGSFDAYVRVPFFEVSKFLVRVRHRPLPVLGLLSRVSSAGSSLAGLVVLASSAFLGPSLAPVGARSGLRASVGLPRGPLAASVVLVELVFVACVDFAELGLLAVFAAFSQLQIQEAAEVSGLHRLR